MKHDSMELYLYAFLTSAMSFTVGQFMLSAVGAAEVMRAKRL
jgi:hypothetical protein